MTIMQVIFLTMKVNIMIQQFITTAMKFKLNTDFNHDMFRMLVISIHSVELQKINNS